METMLKMQYIDNQPNKVFQRTNVKYKNNRSKVKITGFVEYPNLI